MTRRVAYLARWVLPISAPPIVDGVVVATDGRIAFVGPVSEASAALDGAEIIALGDAILLPGLVNAHSHLELTALRGFLEGLDFRQWLRTLTAVRTELLDANALYDSARTGIDEGLLHGITTFADTAASMAPLAAMRDANVRGIGYIETFGPHPAQRDEAMAALVRTVNVERMLDTALVCAGVSPHAPYTVSAPLFRAVADLAVRESLPVAVHVAESDAETMFVRDGAGAFADGLRARDIPVAPQARSPIAFLEQCGVLAAKPLLIHAIHVDADDARAIADRGATVVHCPISNLKLGQGIARVDVLLEAGIAVGLGTDSVASNDRMDMLSEARQAALLQSLVRGTPDALSASDALGLATLGGAACLRLDGEVGSLDVGKRADLTAFALDDEIAAAVYDPAVMLVHVLAGSARARLTVVDGRVLVRDGALVDRDSGRHSRMLALGERLQRWRADASLRWRIH